MQSQLPAANGAAVRFHGAAFPSLTRFLKLLRDAGGIKDVLVMDR